MMQNEAIFERNEFMVSSFLFLVKSKEGNQSLLTSAATIWLSGAIGERRPTFEDPPTPGFGAAGEDEDPPSPRLWRAGEDESGQGNAKPSFPRPGLLSGACRLQNRDWV
jgi:hypothetical protein